MRGEGRAAWGARSANSAWGAKCPGGRPHRPSERFATARAAAVDASLSGDRVALFGRLLWLPSMMCVACCLSRLHLFGRGSLGQTRNGSGSLSGHGCSPCMARGQSLQTTPREEAVGLSHQPTTVDEDSIAETSIATGNAHPISRAGSVLPLSGISGFRLGNFSNSSM